MSRPQHSTGKRERPSYAGVIAFLCVLLLPLEFLVPFLTQSPVWLVTSVILIISTMGILYACICSLEATAGRHKAEDDWTADDWSDIK
jgi:hypothetical protein